MRFSLTDSFVHATNLVSTVSPVIRHRLVLDSMVIHE